MNCFRLSALGALTGIALVVGCGSSKDATPPSNAVQADTSNPQNPQMTAFEKRLKFARLPPRVLGEAAMASTPLADEAEPAHAGYPAFAPNVPTVVSQGGHTLKNPRIVTITWDGDPNRDAYEAFGDQIGATSYWRQNTAEYGVGPAVSGEENHVHLSQAITTISDEEIDNLVRTSIKDASSGWPKPDDQTIYTIYLPPNALTFNGQNACNFGVGGYHTDSPMDVGDGGASQGNGAQFMYAVNINCPNKWDVHTITLIASHELVETVTDPFPNTAPAYVGFDADHLANDFFNQFQDETGDACEFFRSSEFVGAAPFSFGLQRNWSNKSAKAGHAPCVPRTKLPYFNVTTFASKMDQIAVDLTSLGDTVHMTSGFNATAGQPTTFDIGFYSDAPTGGDWTVWAKVPANLPLRNFNTGAAFPNGQAAATIDNPVGHNGHKAHVTVTPSAFNEMGIVYMELHSVLQGGEEKVFPLFLGAPNVPDAGAQ